MKKKIIKIIMLIPVFSCFLFVGGHIGLSAESLAIKDLIAESELYDAKQVVIEAEAIGHIMRRGQNVWVNVNDGTAAIGVWADKDQAGIIKFLGKYNAAGDFLRINGRFNARCQLHGGDMDIHVEKLEVLRDGYYREFPTDNNKIKLFLFLAGVAACLYITKRLKKV